MEKFKSTKTSECLKIFRPYPVFSSLVVMLEPWKVGNYWKWPLLLVGILRNYVCGICVPSSVMCMAQLYVSGPALFGVWLRCVVCSPLLLYVWPSSVVCVAQFCCMCGLGLLCVAQVSCIQLYSLCSGWPGSYSACTFSHQHGWVGGLQLTIFTVAPLYSGQAVVTQKRLQMRHYWKTCLNLFSGSSTFV